MIQHCSSTLQFNTALVIILISDDTLNVEADDDNEQFLIAFPLKGIALLGLKPWTVEPFFYRLVTTGHSNGVRDDKSFFLQSPSNPMVSEWVSVLTKVSSPL